MLLSQLNNDNPRFDCGNTLGNYKCWFGIVIFFDIIWVSILKHSCFVIRIGYDVFVCDTNWVYKV